MVISSVNSICNTSVNMSKNIFSQTVCSLTKKYLNSPNNVARSIIGIAAAEMAIRTFVDFGRLFHEETRQRGVQDLTADLGGAIFYGLAAANILPYSGMIGGLIFLLQSVNLHCRRSRIERLIADHATQGGDAQHRPVQQDDYFTARVLGFIVGKVPEYIKNFILEKIDRVWDQMCWVSSKLRVDPICLGWGVILLSVAAYGCGSSLMQFVQKFFTKVVV